MVVSVSRVVCVVGEMFAKLTSLVSGASLPFTVGENKGAVWAVVPPGQCLWCPPGYTVAVFNDSEEPVKVSSVPHVSASVIAAIQELPDNGSAYLKHLGEYANSQVANKWSDMVKPFFEAMKPSVVIG